MPGQRLSDENKSVEVTLWLNIGVNFNAPKASLQLGNQWSVISRQESVISRQLSVISRQESVIRKRYKFHVPSFKFK